MSEERVKTTNAMPQIFQVLRCYKCLVFQVHQTKKSNKFGCKLCGEKQSIKRHYGIGTAKDCRLHVQKLNGIRGEIDELKESESPDSDVENSPVKHVGQSCPENIQSRKSKWLDYVDKKEEVTEHVLELETMYLNNTEVVLEKPIKRRKINFNCPNLKFEESKRDSNSAKTSCSIKPLEYCGDTIDEKPIVDVNKCFPPQLTTKKVVDEFIQPAVNSNSKWAQFVEEQKETSDDENLFLNNENFREFNVSHVHEERGDEDEPLDINSKDSHELFALCDDSELDNVLDI